MTKRAEDFGIDEVVDRVYGAVGQNERADARVPASETDDGHGGVVGGAGERDARGADASERRQVESVVDGAVLGNLREPAEGDVHFAGEEGFAGAVEQVFVANLIDPTGRQSVATERTTRNDNSGTVAAEVIVGFETIGAARVIAVIAGVVAHGSAKELDSFVAAAAARVDNGFSNRAGTDHGLGDRAACGTEVNGRDEFADIVRVTFVRVVQVPAGVLTRLFEEGQDADQPGGLRRFADERLKAAGFQAGGREGFVCVVELQGGQADLLEVTFALDGAGTFAGRLDGGKQEGDERADDRDDDQEFDEREGSRST